MVTTNMKVTTPIGEGVVQGQTLIGQGEESARGVVVRLKVNDVIRSQLGQSNCLTPHAQASALFVFAEGALA